MSAQWPEALTQGWPAPPRWLTPLALYLVAALALLYRLPEWPPYLFNWENYTVWRYWRTWAGGAPPGLVVLQPTDGLMTDSGFGPLTGGPIWLAAHLGLDGFAMLRVPLALLAALAGPLLWALGRRLASERVALLAALLLAVSPVFVLYGRTATIVAVSLLPALGAMVALADVLLTASARRRRWSLGLLQVALAGGVFAYAPVRLLWPLAVGALLVVAATDHARRRERATAAALTITGVPAVLLALTWLQSGDLNVAAVGGYFQARGEQIMSFGTDPAAFAPFLRAAPAATSPVALVTALVRQNGGDLGRLLLDWRTEPTALQFWSQRGQLWPALHALCFLIGLGWLAVAALCARNGRAALWLWLLAGLTLPLLATSQVHVGRLVPALPVLVLTAAQGARIGGGWLWRAVFRRVRLEEAMLPLLLPLTLAAALVGVSVVTTWYGYSLLAATDPTTPVIAAVRRAGQSLPPGVGVAMVGPAAWGAEVEAVRASALWLALGGEFTVVDLSRAQAEASSDGRPPLYVGGVREAMAAGTLPNPCAVRFVAWPEATDELADVVAAVAAGARCPAGRLVVPEAVP